MEFQAVGVRQVIDGNIFQRNICRPGLGWAPDGVNRGRDALPIEFCQLPGAKCLRKRREPLKEVTQLPIHGEPISDMDEVRKKFGVQSFHALIRNG